MKSLLNKFRMSVIALAALGTAFPQTGWAAHVTSNVGKSSASAMPSNVVGRVSNNFGTTSKLATSNSSQISAVQKATNSGIITVGGKKSVSNSSLKLGDAVSLNPQPLPPKDASRMIVDFGDKVSLNPQPLPPKQHIFGKVTNSGTVIDGTDNLHAWPTDHHGASDGSKFNLQSLSRAVQSPAFLKATTEKKNTVQTAVTPSANLGIFANRFGTSDSKLTPAVLGTNGGVLPFTDAQVGAKHRAITKDNYDQWKLDHGGQNAVGGPDWSTASDFSKATGSGKVDDGSDLVVGPAPHAIVKRLKADPYKKLKNSDSGVDFGSDSESYPAHQGFFDANDATATKLQSVANFNQSSAAALTPSRLQSNMNRSNFKQIVAGSSQTRDFIDDIGNGISDGAKAFGEVVGDAAKAYGHAVEGLVEWEVNSINDPASIFAPSHGSEPSSPAQVLDANQFTQHTQGRVNKVPLLYKGKNLTTEVVGRADKEITPNKMAAANVTRVQTGITPAKMEAANSVGILQNYTPAGMAAANAGGFDNTHVFPIVH